MTRQVCNVCLQAKDLRYGACFGCADYVKTDDFMAWDVRNPMNRWLVHWEPRTKLNVYLGS